jgi:hypothetical protein
MGESDLSWVRDVGIAARLERGTVSGHAWVLLSFPETSIHHGERCLWRLAIFAAGSQAPLFSLDLERDILGGFCLSLVSGSAHRILRRYDAAPGYLVFRKRALAEARTFLALAPAAGARTGQAAMRRN